MRKTTAWIGVTLLVTLGARTIAYAVSPSPLAAEFEHRAGGPALPIVVAVSLALAVAVAAAVVWLASLGVRERRLLEPRPLLDEPRLRLRALVVRAVALAAGSAVAFTLLESYLHWRAGLGWHGIHCLVGPVHTDALPILVALSLIAAALATALEHVLAWMRRTLARLMPAPLIGLHHQFRPLHAAALRAVAATAAVARGPPSFA
jgi:hypothetical protein